MKNFLGVEFAPLGIPIERRLQMASVVLHTLMFTLLPLLFLLLLCILFFTRFFWLPLAYLAWIAYDVIVEDISSHGGRRFESIRHNLLWKYFRDYFPLRLIKTAELPPRNNYILGYHPHGIMGCGAFGSFASEATGFSKKFPVIRPHLLTLKPNFRFPIIRGFLLWNGVCDVSKASLRWILTKQGPGNAAIIVVGGAEEALNAHPGNYDLTLKSRKGFVKMAIETGASLVPVFSFGENDLFYQAKNPQGSYLRAFQEKFKKVLGFSPPVFYGRGVFNYTFGMIPFRKPIHTVVGKPIDLEQCDHPTQEMIDSIHQRYMDELSQLFDEHKTNYDIDENKKLNFI